MATKKKTTTPRKSARKTTAAKAKKTIAAKAAKKSKTSTAARKGRPSKKAARKAAAETRPVESAESKASADALRDKVESIRSNSKTLKRRGENNTSQRGKHTLTAFTIQEARDYIKKRQKEERAIREEEEKNHTAVQPAATPAKATVTADIGDQPLPKSKRTAASLTDILGFNPGSGASRDASQNVPAKWRKYYDMLIALRDEVHEELNMHSSETLKRSQKDDAGDIVTSADAGTDNFDRDFALSLLSSEQEALKEIQAAIQRIHNGTFGICEITGKPINAERLEAVPFTRFSLEGQRQHEMNARRRVQRTGAFLHEGSADNLSFGDEDGDN